MDTGTRTTPETGAHAHQRPKRDMSHIQGWGADLDPKNRPAYPKERTPPRLDNVHWDVPEQQPVNIKVHHSIERPDVTPVFGTSTPPAGWSGKIRDFAFTLSENDIRHWLLLMFADRVNVVEGIGQDLREGHVPNILGEMGIRAEIRHNPVGFAAKVLVVGGIIGLAYSMRQSKKLR
jgi:hypothetical protein